MTNPSQKKVGEQSFVLANCPVIITSASIVGPSEGQGPLSSYFDLTIEDEMWGEESWEKAESKIVKETFLRILSKGGVSEKDVDIILAGDLLNQCIAATFAFRGVDVPFLGLYGACSTIAESICVGSMLVDGGFASKVVCMTSSHFCSAERQFRAPLDLGNQRAPGSQWTVTGSGGILLSNAGVGPKVTSVTLGKIVDLGVKDASNMGAAMAPAAAYTIITHLKDLGRTPDYYDKIFTGDLGLVGWKLCVQLCDEQGYRIEEKLNDCGLLIFDIENQDVHAGGSGCGCSASVFSGYVMEKFKLGEFKRILFVATGALFSPTSSLQGESIPGIAHAFSVEV